MKHGSWFQGFPMDLYRSILSRLLLAVAGKAEQLACWNGFGPRQLHFMIWASYFGTGYCGL